MNRQTVAGKLSVSYNLSAYNKISDFFKDLGLPEVKSHHRWIANGSAPGLPRSTQGLILFANRVPGQTEGIFKVQAVRETKHPQRLPACVCAKSFHLLTLHSNA